VKGTAVKTMAVKGTAVNPTAVKRSAVKTTARRELAAARRMTLEAKGENGGRVWRGGERRSGGGCRRRERRLRPGRGHTRRGAVSPPTRSAYGQARAPLPQPPPLPPSSPQPPPQRKQRRRRPGCVARLLHRSLSHPHRQFRSGEPCSQYRRRALCRRREGPPHLARETLPQGAGFQPPPAPKWAGRPLPK
jgi:hypothetical protein